jgi:Tfp pilus assembly protein PilN
MRAGSILDADMATLGTWLRSGLAWWRTELQAMLPDRLQRGVGTEKRYLTYHGDSGFSLHLHGVSTPVQPDAKLSHGLAVNIAPQLCLVRTIRLPALSEGDLRKLVALDADRIMPLPSASLVLAIKVKGQSGGQAIVEIAGLPRTTAIRLIEDLAAHGVTPGRIGLFGEAHNFDFTGAFNEAGLSGTSGSAAGAWWAVAAFLFMLNIGMLIWRDVQQVDRLAALVEEQGPAVNAARTITRRIDGTQRAAQQLVVRRDRQDAVKLLVAITTILPPKAWIQRFQWDGRIVRLTGYKREGVDVIGALRKSPMFVDVRAANSDVIAEIPTGQPFDVTASIRQPAS